MYKQGFSCSSKEHFPFGLGPLPVDTKSNEVNRVLIIVVDKIDDLLSGVKAGRQNNEFPFSLYFGHDIFDLRFDDGCVLDAVKRGGETDDDMVILIKG